MYVYSVLCAPDARGKGFHPECLAHLCQEYPDADFYAIVRPSNIASLRAFFRMDYNPCALLSVTYRFWFRSGLVRKEFTPEEAENIVRRTVEEGQTA